MDVADLSLKGLGKLECRPALAGMQFVYVPPEVQSDRIGCVVVQISQSFRAATLLGFVKQISTELLPISQLQPLEDLLEYLEEIPQAQSAILAFQTSLPSNKNFVNLKRWIENIFEVGWQEVSDVLKTQTPYQTWSLRSVDKAFLSRGKLVDLGEQMAAQSVALVIAISPENSQEKDIVVEVHPTSGQIYLPSNLQLSVLDFEGVAVMEAQARSTNKNIQLQFSGELGECFSVRVTLGEVSVIENFVI